MGLYEGTDLYCAIAAVHSRVIAKGSQKAQKGSQKAQNGQLFCVPFVDPFVLLCTAVSDNVVVSKLKCPVFLASEMSGFGFTTSNIYPVVGAVGGISTASP